MQTLILLLLILPPRCIICSQVGSATQRTLSLSTLQSPGIDKAKAYLESVAYFMRHGDAIEVCLITYILVWRAWHVFSLFSSPFLYLSLLLHSLYPSLSLCREKHSRGTVLKLETRFVSTWTLSLWWSEIYLPLLFWNIFLNNRVFYAVPLFFIFFLLPCSVSFSPTSFPSPIGTAGCGLVIASS